MKTFQIDLIRWTNSANTKVTPYKYCGKKFNDNKISYTTIYGGTLRVSLTFVFTHYTSVFPAFSTCPGK